MRGTATFIILALLTSFQCISACTLAVCGETRQAHVPPCHPQEAPAPVHHSTHDQACDHQKAADHVRPLMPDLQFAVVADLAPLVLMAHAPAVDAASLVFTRPPLLFSPSSVLRI